MLRPSRLPIVKNDADLDSLSFFSSSAVAASAALATITSLFAVAAFSVAAFSAVVASSCPFFSASCQRGPHRLRSFLPSPSPTRPSPTPRTCVRASRCQTELAHHPRIRISPVDCCWYCSPPEKWLRLQAARPKRRSGSVLSLILQRIPTPSPLGELAIGTSTNLCDSYLRGSCSPSAEGRRRKAKGEKAKRRKGEKAMDDVGAARGVAHFTVIAAACSALCLRLQDPQPLPDCRDQRLRYRPDRPRPSRLESEWRQ